MLVTPSQLRANLYNLLDEVLKTGIPLDIKRNGEILHIIADKKPSKLAQIKAKVITNACDDELINTQWDKAWKPYI